MPVWALDRGDGEELVRLSTGLHDAVVRRDRQAIFDRLGADFRLSAPGPLDGLDRRAWVEAAVGPFVLQSYDVDDVQLQRLSDDVVLLVSRVRQEARFEDRDVSGAFLLSDVWVLRGRRWQLAARHATRLDRASAHSSADSGG